MITAGIDIGTETTKVVILDNNEVIAREVLIGGDEDAVGLGKKALEQATAKAGIELTDIKNIIATGLVGINIPFASGQVAESMCIARGVERVLPSTMIALDLGASKSLVVKCNHGKPIKIARNGKCAAGTGKYLEIVSKLLGVETDEMTGLFLKSKADIDFQSTCAVFLESEVISLIHMKTSPEDIARGAIMGLAKRTYPLLLDVGLEEKITLVGGLAGNRGIAIALEELLGQKLLVPPEPQIVAALGAAIIARERAS